MIAEYILCLAKKTLPFMPRLFSEEGWERLAALASSVSVSVQGFDLRWCLGDFVKSVE